MNDALPDLPYDGFASVVTRIVEADEQNGIPAARSQWAPAGCTCPWPWPLEGHIRTTCPHYVPTPKPRIARTLDGCRQVDGTTLHGRPHTCPDWMRR